MEEIETHQNKTHSSFDVDGYCIRSSHLSSAECAQLAAEVERLHQDFSDLKVDFPHLQKISEWAVGNPHLASSLIYEWIVSETNKRVCQEHLGNNVDLYWSGTAHKPPFTGKAFPWHQDSGYGEGPVHFITCWTALDNVDEENGCFWVITGSHLKGIGPHDLKKPSAETYDGAFLVEAPANEDKAIPIPLRAGEMICFSSELIHETRRNTSARKRRGIIASYVDAGLMEGRQLLTGLAVSLLRSSQRT